jgi:hypothetical protein
MIQSIFLYSIRSTCGMSCPYARLHTWWPVTGMPTMSLGLMYVYRVNVHSSVTVCYWVFRVSVFWWLYKRAKPFPSPLVFLEFLCMRVTFIIYLDFLDAHGDYYIAIVYIHLHSFFAIQFIHENFISISS